MDVSGKEEEIKVRHDIPLKSEASLTDALLCSMILAASMTSRHSSTVRSDSNMSIPSAIDFAYTVVSSAKAWTAFFKFRRPPETAPAGRGAFAVAPGALLAFAAAWARRTVGDFLAAIRAALRRIWSGRRERGSCVRNGRDRPLPQEHVDDGNEARDGVWLAIMPPATTMLLWLYQRTAVRPASGEATVDRANEFIVTDGRSG